MNIPRKLQPQRLRPGLRLAAILLSTFGCVAASAQDFDGIWRSQGYATVVEVRDGHATLYDETAISFFPVATATVQGSVARLDDDPLADPFFLQTDELQLVVVNEATTLRFDRLQNLPPIRGADPSPLNVFDVFWQTIHENFPSFTLLELDWSAQWALWRPQVHANLTARALQDLLAAMAQPLLDGHTTLLNPSSGRFINTGPAPSPLGGALAQAVLDNVEINYLNGGQFNRIPNDSRFLWGTLENGRFGFLAIRDYENRPADFASSLDHVLADLQDTEALLFDLRHNDGGNNRHALTVGSRLAEKSRVVYQQQARHGGVEEFTPPVQLQVEPQADGYRGRPVYLLTNDGTASAGDVQSLILSSFPYVTQVGEASRGMFSQMLRGLPNGWIMSTSNERFLSQDGHNYELVGIDPELLAVNTQDALARGEDLIVDAALADHDKRLLLESGSLPVSGAMSGSWYAPDHDGEGFLLEVLDDQTAVIYWFSYAPSGGRQKWFAAIGEIHGDRIDFNDVLAPHGARFGDSFDPDDVVRAPWGEMSLRFTSCDRALVTYDGPDAYGANFKSLLRLTGHQGLPCGMPAQPVSNRFSGSWYDPSRSGEGWILGQINDDLALGVWFTYDNDGEPLWLIGTGDIQGDQVIFDDLQEPVGGKFGPDFRPGDIQRRAWGRATIRAQDCNAVEVEWQPHSPEYTAGAGSLARLTALATLDCEAVSG